MRGRDEYRNFAKCEAECTKHQKHRADGTPIDSEDRPLDTKYRPILACIEMISAGNRSVSFNVCGRKLKGDAEFPHLCGTHVGVITRGRNKNATRAKLAEDVTRSLADFDARVAAINERYELDAIARTVNATSGPLAFVSRSTGDVVISLARLEALLAELDET
jgi:hypothetical protein